MCTALDCDLSHIKKYKGVCRVSWTGCTPTTCFNSKNMEMAYMLNSSGMVK